MLITNKSNLSQSQDNVKININVKYKMTKSIMYNLCIQQSMNTKNDLKLITFSFLILTFQKKECISFLEISYKKMCDFMHTKIITVLKRELLFDCSIYSIIISH